MDNKLDKMCKRKSLALMKGRSHRFATTTYYFFIMRSQHELSFFSPGYSYYELVPIKN